MDDKDYEGIEKREYFRILYSKMDKPVFRVGSDSFEILDISNRGIRFINDRNVRLTHYVTGELLFLSGESIRVEGILK